MNGKALKKKKKKKKKEEEKKETIIAIIFLACVVVVMLSVILFRSAKMANLFSKEDIKINMETGKKVTGGEEYSEYNEGGENISFPGYEKIKLAAGKKKQHVYLYNPKGNTCYFKMRMLLEDGTIIWESDELEPGNAFSMIILEQSLKKGVYANAVLQYESYALTDRKALNGATIQMSLVVE